MTAIESVISSALEAKRLGTDLFFNSDTAKGGEQ